MSNPSLADAVVSKSSRLEQVVPGSSLNLPTRHDSDETDKSQRSQLNIVDLGMSIVGLGLPNQARDNVVEHQPLPKVVDASKLEYQFLNFDKDQPPSDEIVEALFEESLRSRAFTSDALRNLRSISILRKWKLICQDHYQPDAPSTTTYDAGWFVSRMKHLGSKELHKLERLLRTRDFVEEFMGIDGHLKLTEIQLNQLDEEKEFLVIHCFKNIINLPRGSDIVAQDFHLVEFLVRTLLESTKINNRKTLTEVLVLISYWSPPLGRNNILKSFSRLSQSILFDTWLKSLEDVLSEDFFVFTNMVLKELILSSMFLIISLIEGAESSNDKKIIHLKLKESGLYALIQKMRLIDDQLVDEQIERYKSMEQATIANDILVELNLGDSQFDLMTKTIKVRTSSDEELFEVVCNIEQQLLEILESNSLSQSLKLFKFIETLVGQVSKSNSLSEGGESILHISIQKLMDQMTTDELARRAMNEAQIFEEKSGKLEKEIKMLKETLGVSGNDIFKRNDELQQRLEGKDLEILQLKTTIDEMKNVIASQKYEYSKSSAKISLTNQPLFSAKPSRSYVQDSQNLLQSLRKAQQASNVSYSQSQNKGKRSPGMIHSKSSLSLLSNTVLANGDTEADTPASRSPDSSWESIGSIGGPVQVGNPSYTATMSQVNGMRGSVLAGGGNGQIGLESLTNNSSSSSFESVITYSSFRQVNVLGPSSGNMAPVVNYSSVVSGARPSLMGSNAGSYSGSNRTESSQMGTAHHDGSSGVKHIHHAGNGHPLLSSSGTVAPSGVDKGVTVAYDFLNGSSVAQGSYPSGVGSNVLPPPASSASSLPLRMPGYLDAISTGGFQSTSAGSYPFDSIDPLASIPPPAPILSDFLNSSGGSSNDNASTSVSDIHTAGLTSNPMASVRVTSSQPSGLLIYGSSVHTGNIIVKDEDVASFGPPPLFSMSPSSVTMPSVSGTPVSAVPPAPKLPEFLDIAPATQSTASAPPPPPPKLPDFLATAKVDPSKSAAPPPPPPPPPPVPSFMSKSEPDLTKKEAAGPPPPPPPMPGFMSKSQPDLLKKEEIGTPPVPPPPPPPPSTLSQPKLKVNTTLKPESSRIDELSRQLHRPSRKLKQLHWDKINDDLVKDTFWGDALSNSRIDELKELGVLNEVEDLFTVKEIQKKASPMTPIDKKELISFLPRDLSQQFGINLHMFAALSENELVLKVLKCDSDVMESISVLEFFNKDELCTVSSNILKNLKPYSTDFILGKAPEKDITQLERADRIYVELCVNLRHYWRSRSRGLLVIKTYEKDYHDLVAKIQRVDDSVKAIRNSKALKNLFIIIREIGNFMNRKQVDGFKLASLSKLSFIKDHNQKTFLHYVEKVVRTAYPEYLKFLEELLLLQETAKISTEQLSTDITAFIKSVRNIELSVQSGNLSDSKTFHPDDRVLTKINPKLPEALRKCQLLEDQHKFIIGDFEKLMKYFGENPADSVSRSTFLQKFQDFANDFKRAQKENLDNEEKNKIYQKRKELMLQSKKAKEIRTKSEGNGNETEDDVVANLLKRLKGASSERRRVSTSGVAVPSRSRSVTDEDNKLLSRAKTMLEDTRGI
jgi:hypothetical protein